MHYIYVLQNQDYHEFYYGYTIDLERRLAEHKSRKKCELVYYEAYRSEKDARSREKKLKNYGQTRSHLKKRIENSVHKN